MILQKLIWMFMKSKNGSTQNYEIVMVFPLGINELNICEHNEKQNTEISKGIYKYESIYIKFKY